MARMNVFFEQSDALSICLRKKRTFRSHQLVDSALNALSINMHEGVIFLMILHVNIPRNVTNNILINSLHVAKKRD